MAENIVGGLFGVNPAQLMRQRQEADANTAFKFANLSAGEQAQYGAFMGGQQLGRAASNLLGGGDPELQKVSAIQQLASQFDIATPTGMRDFARALQPIAPNESMVAAKRADEMMAVGEQTKLRTAQTEQAQAGRIIQVDLGDRIQLINALTKEVIREIPKGLTPAQTAKALRDAEGGGTDGVGKLTPAQKAVDTKFSKEYTDFVSAGGSTAVAKNLQMLDDAIKIIEEGADGDTSGKIVGLSDKTGTLSYTHPKAAEAKDLIGGVAQSNLRAILGGQFAAREGEQLLARAYNTAQPKKDNLNRLKALRKQIQDAAEAKINASQYYEEKGTLKGFKGNYSVTPDLATATNNDPLGLRKK
jgi:hypothetical protein